MPERKLKAILSELHEQLEAAPDLDPASRQALEAAADEIRGVLADGTRHTASIQGRLRSAIEEFEDSHPNLTSAVGRLADALADLGI